MATRKKMPPSGGASRRGGVAGTDVEAFMRTLEHPLRDDIEAVRQILLGVDPSIEEAVKWNAPSFRTADFFATFHLRSQDQVQLVFHTGAKAKATAVSGIEIADPAGLAAWRANDRCVVTLGAGSEIATRRAAFEAFVREWLRWV